MAKGLRKFLPKDRPYTELEAAYSLQLDYDEKKTVTVTGYMHLWQWGKGRVMRFLERMGCRIEYPKSTGKLQNQRGLIVILIPDRYRTDNGLMRLIDSKGIGEQADGNRTDNGLKADRSRYATRKPNPKSQSRNNYSIQGATPFDWAIGVQEGEPSPPSTFDLSKALSRYNDHQLVRDVIAALATTRKSGKIADSVIEAQFAKWQRCPVSQVEEAMRKYLDKDCAGEGKGENYLCGIIRKQNDRYRKGNHDKHQGYGGAPQTHSGRDEKYSGVGETVTV